MNKILISFLKFLTAFILLYFSSIFIDKFGMIVYAVSVLIIWIPVFLNYASRYSLLKEIKLIAYEKNKSFYKFISGKTLGYIFLMILSLFFAFVIPVRIFLFSSIEFLCLLIIFPFMILGRASAVKLIPKIYNNKFAPYKIESFSYIFTAVFSALTFPIIVYLLKDINIHIPSLDNNIMDLQHNYTAYSIGSIIVFFDNIFNTIIYSEFTKSLSFRDFSIILIILGSGGIIFYALVNFIAFFFIKKENLRKVFLPLESNSQENKINKFLSGFIITLLIIFIYPAIFASLSIISMSKMGYVEKTIEANTKAVEIINNIMYKAGTIEEIETAKNIAYGASKEELILSINNGYDKLVNNVDSYLDWYYSLPAEYSRLIKLISGKLENYMADTLKEKLLTNADFNVDVNVINKNADLLHEKINEILKNNQITNNIGDYRVVTNLNVESIYDLSNVEPLFNIKNRIIASTGGGLAAGAVVGTIVGKIVSKTFFKTTAKAIAKASAGKVLSAAAGAVAGTAASIFTSPVGGVAIGTATGVAIDKGLLSLEEAVNREKYKQEIISNIEESRKNSIAIIENAFKNQ